MKLTEEILCTFFCAFISVRQIDFPNFEECELFVAFFLIEKLTTRIDDIESNSMHTDIQCSVFFEKSFMFYKRQYQIERSAIKEKNHCDVPMHAKFCDMFYSKNRSTRVCIAKYLTKSMLAYAFCSFIPIEIFISIGFHESLIISRNILWRINKFCFAYRKIGEAISTPPNIPYPFREYQKILTHQLK